MAKRRTFTPEFKAEVVIEALCGQTSQAELCRKHNISDVQLSKWKRQLLENAAPLLEPNDKQNQASQQRITQLEQLCWHWVILHLLNLRKKLVLNNTEFWSKKSMALHSRIYR